MATSKKRRRGPKAGSTAIPFMITFLISLFVFGGVGLYFYNKLTVKNNELQPMQSATTSISDADVNSILFVLDPTEDNRKDAVMMMRFDPVRKMIFCIGVPLDLKVEHENKTMSVQECYSTYGMEALKNAVSVLLDQPIDRYMKMDSEGFKKLVTLIGNVTYRIPIRDQFLKPTEAPATLDNDQFVTLLTSMNYKSEEERCNVIGNSIATLLNQCMGGEEYARSRGETDGGKRVARNLDSYFSAIINDVTTDITAMDFSDHRHAISYVFEFAQAPARGMGVICDIQADGTLVPNPTFLNNLKITFYQVSVNGSGSDDGSTEDGAEGEAGENAEPVSDDPEAANAAAPADQ
ncbi:MAG: LCP family protein [Oscillospiraceae bacterium]|nr:LCP family protein [Oscillospiraceae bacterium]